MVFEDKAYKDYYYTLLIGCSCYCPLWPCRPMLYDLGSTAHNG